MKFQGQNKTLRFFSDLLTPHASKMIRPEDPEEFSAELKERILWVREALAE